MRESETVEMSSTDSLHKRRFDAKPDDVPETLTVRTDAPHKFRDSSNRRADAAKRSTHVSVRPNESSSPSDSSTKPADEPAKQRNASTRPGDCPSNDCIYKSIDATLKAAGDASPKQAGKSSLKADASPTQVNRFPNHTSEDDVESILQRLSGRRDLLSLGAREAALDARAAVEALDHLDSLHELMSQLLLLKHEKERLERRARDTVVLSDMTALHKRVAEKMECAYREHKELELLNDALNADLDPEFGHTMDLLESILGTSRGASLKRSSRWKPQKLRGSLLGKQRSRSVGGEEGNGAVEARLSVPTAEEYRKVDKSKVSKWTTLKSAFKWEKAHHGVAGGAAGVVGAAGALVGAVAMAGSTQQSPETPLTPAAPPADESACVTPGSMLSLTPNSSCEELRVDSGPSRKSGLRCDDNDNSFLHAPILDDSSTSPSPNKLHKTAWGKMRDIIGTRQSVRRRQRASRSTGHDAPSSRRRSFSDAADSDAPPVLTLTIPSSEEFDPESEGGGHAPLHKQRSLELGGRPPAGRQPRPASKWSKVKKAFLTSASASVPSSPSRHSAFFTDHETEGVSSGCEASTAGGVRDEIRRDYAALQSRLGQEFSDKRDKLYAVRPVATEEQLSAEFRKKLAEWRARGGAGGVARQPPPVPRRSDLSDDFLTKWDEWNRLKETNSVPAWAEEARPDEVLVQTSTGLVKFQGISRSFTRKLHKWEKARGIAPEASTSALLRAAQGNKHGGPASASNTSRRQPAAAPLARAQSAGSVAMPLSGAPPTNVHGSSFSVNDAELDMQYDHTDHTDGGVGEASEGSSTEDARGAVIVVVEAEEVCTAAPLVAVSPRHTPQKPVYTYDHDGTAGLRSQTSSAPALLQQQLSTRESNGAKLKELKQSYSQRSVEKNRRPVLRQASIEDDAQFIRRTIEEIERGGSGRGESERGEDAQWRTADRDEVDCSQRNYTQYSDEGEIPPGSSRAKQPDADDDSLRRQMNGKKKLKTRARLEREPSKPSESDSAPECDTITVEMPRRKKRVRRPTDRPRTPPDADEQVYVLKLRAPEQRAGFPEVIVRTKRKIFSPVVVRGETTSAVVPLDVDELVEVTDARIKPDVDKEEPAETSSRLLQVALESPEAEPPRSRPPLPSSPSAQRRPPSKETAPSIRIMIQRYNLKINEDGHTSPASSGTSSPAWRSPAAERRRPPDMPARVNIRNNPFFEREVQKSASACQLSRRDPASAPLADTPAETADGVLKSRSAYALISDARRQPSASPTPLREEPESEPTTSNHARAAASTAHNSQSTLEGRSMSSSRQEEERGISSIKDDRPAVQRLISSTSTGSVSRVSMERFMSGLSEERRESLERMVSVLGSDAERADDAVSERTRRVRAARARFLSSPGVTRRDHAASAADLRPDDRNGCGECVRGCCRLSRASCDGEPGPGAELGRSASTGMVNVDPRTWQRVQQESRRRGSSNGGGGRFSLSRLAARLRRRPEERGGAVTRLCRQSLLVQLRPEQ